MTEKQISKRRHILQCASTIFASKGFEHSSIRDIAISAQVADGTIYNYFKNKQDLLEAIIQELLVNLGQAESQAIGLSEPNNLESNVLSRMANLHDNYVMLAAVLPVILSSSELRDRFRQDFIQPVLANLEKEIGGVHAAIPARILMSTVLGFQLLMVLGDETTAQAWDKPDTLAPLWSKIIKQFSPITN